MSKDSTYCAIYVEIITILQMRCNFLAAKATSDNIVNATSQIYYQNDQKNEVVIVIFYNVLFTSLCLLG